MELLAFAGRTALFMATVLLVLAGGLRLVSIKRNLKVQADAEGDLSETPAYREDALGIWAHRLNVAAWILSTGALLLLILLFVTDAFAFSYVAGRSNRAMATVYKVTAVWAGQEGSLLLWLWIQSGYGLIVSHRARLGRLLDRGAAAFLSLISAFFALLVAYVASPFVLQVSAPLDGAGMNPILQNYWMTAHPVMLYFGYIGLSVPFAYAASSLLTSTEGWIQTTRRWTLTAWAFLSLGILFGAIWAYGELGWGGYWGWDPVENASFMPWLISTAFMHSAIIEAKRGMLKRWNHVLVFLAFLLVLFGTFVTRSGILASVHAFVESDISPWFIGFMGLCTSVFLYLLINKWGALKDERPIDSPASKEASFLANNVVLLATTFAIFWGTVFPLVAAAFGRQVTVGSPYFDRVTGPLFLILILLMGVGPLIAWRQASFDHLKKQFTAPVLNAIFMAIWLWVVNLKETVTLLTLPAVVFVATTLVMEFAKGAQTRSRSRGEPLWLALLRAMNRNPARYGGYIVHLGILFIVVGVAFSTVYQQENNVVLAVGEQMNVGPYTVTFNDLKETVHGHVPAVEATLLISGRNGPIGYALPSKRFYPTTLMNEGPTSKTAVFSSWGGDFYAVLAGWEPYGSLVGFKFYYNPLVWCIWAGGFLLIVGALFSLWPRSRGYGATSEVYLASLAELEYDRQMGKVEEKEYRALFAEFSPKALSHLKAEAKAARKVLSEVLAELDAGEGGGRSDRSKGGAGVTSLFLAVGLALAMSFAVGGEARAQTQAFPKAFEQVLPAGAMSDNGVLLGESPAEATMGMPDGPAVPRDVMVLRLSEGRLHVLNLVTVTHPGTESVDEIRLTLPPEATAVVVNPDHLILDADAAVDQTPMQPGETRTYSLQYTLLIGRWPYGLRRLIQYPTAELQLLTLLDEVQISGVDLETGGTETVADQSLFAHNSRWLAPGETWHAIVTPGPAAGMVPGWNPSLAQLPVVAEGEVIPGDWLWRSAKQSPLAATVLLLAVAALGVAGWKKAQNMPAQTRSTDGSAASIPTRGANQRGKSASIESSLGGSLDEVESLLRAIARLDLAYREGVMAEGAYRRRRTGLMDRMNQRIAGVDPRELRRLDERLAREAGEAEASRVYRG